MPGQFLSNLDLDTAADLISAAADVVLIMDESGVIQDLALSSEDIDADLLLDWRGKNWAQTVTVESQPKIAALLKGQGALTSDGVRWRHVNHKLGDGGELPLSYSVVPVRRQGEALSAAIASKAFRASSKFVE